MLKNGQLPYMICVYKKINANISMGGGGFGALDSMIKSIKNNANLLRRKSLFEVMKESGDFKKKKPYEYKKASEEDLLKINKSMKLKNQNTLFKQIAVLCVLIALFSFAAYYMFFSPSKQVSSLGKPLIKDYFSVETKPLENNFYLKVEYFDIGSIAAETKIKNGLRHQQSESYYPNGKQFRSAAYWYDTLINEVYFAPSGDTIKHMKKWSLKEPSFIRLKGYDQNEYTFYCSEGKIIPNTFKEE